MKHTPHASMSTCTLNIIDVQANDASGSNNWLGTSWLARGILTLGPDAGLTPVPHLLALTLHQPKCSRAQMTSTSPYLYIKYTN